MQLSNHALDIESISVIKTHLLSIFIIIVAFGIAWKFVLPKFLDLYKTQASTLTDRYKEDSSRKSVDTPSHRSRSNFNLDDNDPGDAEDEFDIPAFLRK